MEKTSNVEYIIEGEIQEKTNASPYNIYHHIYPRPENDKKAFEEFEKMVSEKRKCYHRFAARLIKRETVITESMLT